MKTKRNKLQIEGLLVLLLAYCAASLLHYAHNAAFLDHYPNMPTWLSPVGIHVAWFAATAIGIVGYLFMRGGRVLAGLVLIAIYGVLGLDGLSHYGLAPFSEHTFTMNLTILLEAATALLVLGAVARMAVQRSRAEARP
jgi:hypothetical protein